MKSSSFSIVISHILAGIRLYKKVFCGVALISFSALAQAPLDIRIALIIGNSDYINFPKLANPGNDANSMSAVLTRLGFKVIRVSDGTKEQMETAITQMQAFLKGKQAVAMLYYAGHGLQLNWHNYMVATDSQIDKAEDIPKETIDIDRVLQAFKNSSTRLNIIVLDACRDNPFESKSSGRGLSQVDAPINTYISFATAPGNVALDGNSDSANGLYTQYILKELQRPAPVEDMFKRVRLQVRKASHGAQIPWDSTSLEVDFAFNDGNKFTLTPNESSQKKSEGIQEFKTLKNQDRITEFSTQMTEWHPIKRSLNANDYYSYLDQYPSGLLAEQCIAKLNQLAPAKITEQADQHGIIQRPNEQRFRVGDEYELVTRDGFTGRVIGRSSRRVEKIENGLVYIAQLKEPGVYVSIFTLYGAAVKSLLPSGAYEYDPPKPFQPAEVLQVGKKWASVSIETHGNKEDSSLVNGKVLSFEKLIVPAGTFNTYKVSIQTQNPSLGVVAESLYWFEPGWGIPIKTVKKGELRQGVGIYEIEDLVFRKRGREVRFIQNQNSTY
jgi:hypothetical protein